jgi:hypothetical protein
MADGSAHDSDDEEGEDGEEGEDDDEGSVDNQSSPSKPLRPISTPPPVATDIPSAANPDTDMAGTEAAAHPPLLHIDRERLEIKSGSPLKNVALTTSALTSPLESPSNTAAPPFSEPAPKQDLNPILETAESASLDETMQRAAAATPPTTLPPPPPEPTLVEEIAAKEVLAEEEEEEEMLLDIVENANNANIGEDEILAPITPEIYVPIQEVEAQQPEMTIPEALEVPAKQAEVENDNQKEELISAPPVAEETEPEVPQPAEDEDDDFPDLLGGLEKQLNEPVAQGQQSVVEPIPEAVKKAASPETPVKSVPREQDEKISEAVEEKTEEKSDGA